MPAGAVGHDACVEEEWLSLPKLTVPYVPKRPPAIIVPVPAANCADPVGRRALVGTAGRGWHGDMRVIDGPRLVGGRTTFTIAPEWEFYRLALALQLAGDAGLHPQVHDRLRPPPAATHPVLVERLWIEMPLEMAGGHSDQDPGHDAGHGHDTDGPGGGQHGLGHGHVAPATSKVSSVFDRVVSLDAPAARQPVPIRDVSLLLGRRLVVVGPDGEWRDVRAMSEIYANDDGDLTVQVCDEASWYRWSMTGERIAPRAIPIHLAWAE